MNRKILIITLFLCVCLGMAACGSTEGSEPISSDPNEITLENKENTEEENGQKPVEVDSTESNTGSKVLVAYFSRTGHTAQLAEYASEILDANLYEIVAADPYTDEDIDYGDDSSRTSIEQNDASIRPEIDKTVEDMSQYDTIVLAYPIWWGQAPRIINTFLESYDFSETTIIPFCTSASSNIGSSDDDLHGFVSEDATWIDGRRFAPGTSKEELQEWLESRINPE